MRLLVRSVQSSSWLDLTALPPAVENPYGIISYSRPEATLGLSAKLGREPALEVFECLT